MATDIQVGDIGTILEFIVKDNGVVLNISGATSKTLYIKKPNNTLLTLTPTFVTDGTDGKVQYITLSGDLSVKGTYKAQVKIILTSGEWNSNVISFKVLDNIHT